MLQFFTNFLPHSDLIMAIHSPNLLSLIHNMGIYARPFDEIVFIHDLSSTTPATMTDDLCLIPTTIKDPNT